MAHRAARRVPLARRSGMTLPQPIVETARAGADSVYGYVERTAEMMPDGVRWQTLTLENEPTYSAMLGPTR